MKPLLWAIVGIGILGRFALAWVNPPSNAYDDHLLAASKYATVFAERPEPWGCWQCYQPSAYYRLAAASARLGETLGMSEPWKMAQLLSAMFSSLCLLIGVSVLWLCVWRKTAAFLAAAAFLSFLPRGLYNAASATNDAMLEFAVSLGILGVMVVVTRPSQRKCGLLLVCASAVLAPWSKQSGLIMLGPAVLALGTLLFSRRRGTDRVLLFLLVVAIVIGGADEAWRAGRTGVFLASNQLYFDHAASQDPGAIEAVSFTSYRAHALVAEVFMSGGTVGSFWTQLFARGCFDYERRFFPVTAFSMNLGRALYSLGLILVAVTLLGLILRFKDRRPALWELIPVFVLIAFLGVPFLQTLRYPFYSSMKASFVVPAAPVMAMLLAWALEALGEHCRAIAGVLLILLVLGGMCHLGSALVLNSEAMSQGLSGPLWQIPPVPR